MKSSKGISTTNSSTLGRRGFLAGAGAGLGSLALLGGCKSDASASSSAPKAASSAGDRPEVTELRFGMIALTDCSPIFIAHEKGMFKKYGIDSTVVKGASWAAIRDSLSNGDIHATHMLTGMPIASTLGLLGAPKLPMVIPWMLNRNGQAITMRADLKGKVGADPKALRPFAEEA